MSEFKRQQSDVLFHTIDAEEAIRILDSTGDGLTQKEAADRLSTIGPNEIKEGKKRTLIVKLFEQFKNVMVVILLVAAAISGLMHTLHEPQD